MSQVTKPDSDLWRRLQALTPSRIGIRSVDGALPTATLLTLQEDHARARDAVFRGVDFEALAATIGPAMPALLAHSAARDRSSYIRFPALGRRLDPESRARLAAERAEPPWDLTVVIGDGLSGDAVTQSALPTLFNCMSLLHGWRLSPVVLAAQARVALGDEISAILNSRLCLMLIGERPGLTVSASLGAYITWAPQVGCHDASRNCVSNIHPEGLSCSEAARTICWILEEARRRGCSGTALKDDTVRSAAAVLPTPGP